jgi:hypothetical protein
MPVIQDILRQKQENQKFESRLGTGRETLSQKQNRNKWTGGGSQAM